MSIRIMELRDRVPCVLCNENLCFEKGYGPTHGICSTCAADVADQFFRVHMGEPLFDTAEKPKRQTPIPIKLRWGVMREDNYTCKMCGARDRPLHVDHIVPRANGGGNDRSNLQCLCDKCNLKKGNKTMDEWGYVQ